MWWCRGLPEALPIRNLTQTDGNPDQCPLRGHHILLPGGERNLDSLFRVFDEDGYHTSFFHPAIGSITVMLVRAEETVFADQMEDLEYKGGPG